MKRAMRAMSVQALLWCLASACGGSSAPAGSSIGASGGVATSTSGGSVTIPAGALNAATNITATDTASAAAPSGTSIVGTPVTFGPEGQTFSSNVTISLPIATAQLDGGSIGSVVIYTAPAGSTSYTALPTTVVDATHVSASVAHFSIFVPTAQLMAVACSTNADCPSGLVCASGVCK